MARSDYKDAQQKVKDGATQAASGVKDSVGEVADNTRKDVQQTAEQADERFLLCCHFFLWCRKKISKLQSFAVQSSVSQVIISNFW